MNCGLIQSPESTPELHNALDPEIYVYMYTGIFIYIYIYLYLYLYLYVDKQQWANISIPHIEAYIVPMRLKARWVRNHHQSSSWG